MLFSSTLPVDDLSSPAQRPSKVVLPLPEGPIMAFVEPAVIEKLMSLSTVSVLPALW